MTANNYSTFKQVTEVYFSNDADKLIQQGWQLINVLQRASIHDKEGAIVVYVLGSNEAKVMDKPSEHQPVILDYSAGEEF